MGISQVKQWGTHPSTRVNAHWHNTKLCESSEDAQYVCVHYLLLN